MHLTWICAQVCLCVRLQQLIVDVSISAFTVFLNILDRRMAGRKHLKKEGGASIFNHSLCQIYPGVNQSLPSWCSGLLLAHIQYICTQHINIKEKFCTVTDKKKYCLIIGILQFERPSLPCPVLRTQTTVASLTCFSPALRRGLMTAQLTKKCLWLCDH